MEGKNESKPLKSMIWPISHNRGDFLAVGISLNDVKALYYDSNGTSSLIDASEETIINKTRYIKELQAEVDRLTKETGKNMRYTQIIEDQKKEIDRLAKAVFNLYAIRK